MTLAEIQDSPDYVNANEATKRAIFEQYSRDDKDFTTANAATQAAIREKFGVADPVETATGGDLAKTAVQTAAGSALSMGPTGLKELTQAGVQAVKPVAQAAIAGPIAAYAANPAKALAVDAVGAALTGGLPLGSAYQSIKSFPEKYKAITEAGKEIGKFSSQGDLFTSPTTGSVYPETVPAFREMQKANPALSQKLSELYGSGGGNNAVKAWLTSPEGQAAMKDPRFAAAAETYMSKIPGMGSQAMNVLGPIARGVVKAAGPVGMGLNLYDAGKMTRETELGQRLAQGQGGRAEQAFRAGPVQSYQGPQIDASQAQNVLQSGSARDIKYFGGADNLREQMRRKAAARVSGPVAPGQQ